MWMRQRALILEAREQVVHRRHGSIHGQQHTASFERERRCAALAWRLIGLLERIVSLIPTSPGRLSNFDLANLATAFTDDVDQPTAERRERLVVDRATFQSGKLFAHDR